MIKGIALIGEPGSGKSSIARYLEVLLFTRGAELRSFAGPLKDEVAHALAASNPQVWRSSGADNYEKYVRQEMDNPDTKDKYRGILQWWGTEYRRSEDPEYWLKKFERSIGFGAVGGFYIVDDCRFDNEYQMLKKYDFAVVFLASGETTRALIAQERIHASEVDWTAWEPDLVLSYEKGPEHQAKRIIEMLKSEL